MMLDSGQTAVIGGLTCVVLGRLVSLLAGPTAGLIAGLMLAVYPAHVYLSGVFYVACIATYLSLLAIWLVVLMPTARRPLATALAAGVDLEEGYNPRDSARAS